MRHCKGMAERLARESRTTRESEGGHEAKIDGSKAKARGAGARRSMDGFGIWTTVSGSERAFRNVLTGPVIPSGSKVTHEKAEASEFRRKREIKSV